MKIKYKLVYEWEDDNDSILDYADSNNCSFEEAVEDLKIWNKEQFADRIDARADNILSHYTSNFEYKVEDDK